MSVKILIAYMSYYGNSQKLALTLEDQLKEENIECELLSLRKTLSPKREWDAFILISPVRITNVVWRCRRFVRKLKVQDKKYSMIISHAASLDDKFSPVPKSEKLAGKIEKKGYEKITDIIYIPVEDVEGPSVETASQSLKELTEKIVNDFSTTFNM